MKDYLRNIFLLLTVFSSIVCTAQEVPGNTVEIVDKIAENNYVSYVPDGFMTFETPQYALYLQLRKTASFEELLGYLDDNRPVVRIYAIKCLDDKNYDKLFQVAQKHVLDTHKVHQTGFLAGKVCVGDYFASVQNISEYERSQLDSFILNTDNELNYLRHLLSEIEPQEKHYERIRLLAETNEFAVIALARFKKESDIDFIASKILKNPSHSIKAIELFPAEQFKSVLRKLRRRGVSPYGTELAVAAYKSSFSIRYFNPQIKRKGYENQEFGKSRLIFDAIKKHRDSIYTDLFFKIWKNDYILNSTIFNYLMRIEKEKALELAYKTLEHPDRLNNSDLLISTMLDTLLANDIVKAKKIIQFNIVHARVHELEYFVEKAVNFKDKNLIYSMFKRVESSKNGHEYVPIVLAILKYEDKELNQRLLNCIRQNPEIKDWGLREVKLKLKQYGLEL